MSHYIRIDSKNRIIAGFSDAFQQPQAGDICILDDPQQLHRHFELDGGINPPLISQDRQYLYKYINGAVEPASANDNADILQANKAGDIKAQLAALDDVLPRCVEDLIAAGAVDKAKLPQVMQDRITQKESLRLQLSQLTV